MSIPTFAADRRRPAQGPDRGSAGKPIRFGMKARAVTAAALMLAAGALAACSSTVPTRSAAPQDRTGTAAPHDVGSSARPNERGTMRIRLSVGDAVATATLRDNATARDFASLLPLRLRMHDLFGREKAGGLPRALAAGGQPQSTYEVGQLGYWTPSHDLAIYYRNDGEQIPAPGIVIIGQIDSGLDAIATAGDDLRVTITALD
ncbi:MAG: cyclophilin-like fold protein [Actinomycetota bacterium]|nr:cyclophilin-like fold protein [Actinomycetota bacterium]